MESSLLVDREATRRLTTGKNFNSGSNSPTISPSQSLTFEQQQNLLLLLQNQVGGGGNSGGFGFFGPSRPPPFFPNSTPPIPPQPTRSSLPPFPHFQFQSQPSRSSPLLPLPFTRSQSLPSTFTSPPVMPNRKGLSGNNIQRKTKPSSGSRRKPSKDSGSNPTTYTNTPLPPPSRPVPPITKAKVVEVEDPKEEGEIDDDEEEVVYSLSPPPSCLPLPTFTLRPRNGVGCNAEGTKAGVGGGRTPEVGNGSDGSTAEDLRRVLRLQEIINR